MYRSKVVAHSVAPSGKEIVTLEVEFPRFILAEFNTHRMFSRNSASSRAIPIEKQLEKLEEDPFIPEYWGAAQKGMSADHTVDDDTVEQSELVWMKAIQVAAQCAQLLRTMGIHKQTANRLLEPFMWHTAIVTATEWDNFFALRISPHAQPEIRTIAELMKESIELSTPRRIGYGDWHLPYISPEEDQDAFTHDHLTELKWISAGRCARVSYLTHDGIRDRQADIALAKSLEANGHMSPFEHIATPLGSAWQTSGNFHGWSQMRKFLANENDFSQRPQLGADDE